MEMMKNSIKTFQTHPGPNCITESGAEIQTPKPLMEKAQSP
jgi:hypothetical protein